MSVDVSVVVPVYNTELYLRECIESLIHQTLKNVEFIFVDDGSTDRSVEIIEEYQKQDNRIQLIKQKNQYAGVARNNGMKRATGKYIIFLDSDDFFELNMLEEAFKCAEKNQAEIVIFGYYWYNNQTGTIVENPFFTFPKGCFSLENVGSNFFIGYADVPWNKMFLKSFVFDIDLQFQSIKKNNDSFFTHIAACFAKKIVDIKKRFVYYRHNNSTSLTGAADETHISYVQFETAIKQEMVKRNIYFGVYKEAYIEHVCRILRDVGEIEVNEKNMSLYFHSIKEALIPELFDSREDFEHDDWILNVFKSETFDSFLYHQLFSYINKYKYEQEQTRNNYISKKSKDYLIGHAILLIPRKIYNFAKKGFSS